MQVNYYEKRSAQEMAGDTRGSDTLHTRYARKGTELSHQGRRGAAGDGMISADIFAIPTRSPANEPGERRKEGILTRAGGQGGFQRTLPNP